MELLSQLRDIWWLVLTLLGIMTYLVTIHMKVNTAFTGMQKLFTRMEDVEKWKAEVNVKLDTLILNQTANHDRMNVLVSSINLRIDKFIEVLLERRKSNQ